MMSEEKSLLFVFILKRQFFFFLPQVPIFVASASLVSRSSFPSSMVSSVCVVNSKPCLPVYHAYRGVLTKNSLPVQP